MLLINENGLYFPDPRESDDEGLVACGGDFSPERLIFAYSLGIFPWFNEGEQIFWFSPNPRLVLYPAELRIAKSMRPYFNRQKFTFSIDRAFSDVIQACAAVERKNQGGETWISREIIAAYTEMHKLGYAHSAEVWDENGALVGGLYGIALGKVFFGESMFAKASNASKFGFISLVRKLYDWGFELIDCQQETAHLISMGAKSITRIEFMEMLQRLVPARPSFEAFRER